MSSRSCTTWCHGFAFVLAIVFSVSYSSLFKTKGRLGRAAHRLQVVLQTLQNGALFRAALGAALFDQGLDQLREHLTAAQAARVEIIVDLHHVARHPKLHQLVNLIDQRNGAATDRFQPEGAVLAGIPRPELELAATTTGCT